MPGSIVWRTLRLHGLEQEAREPFRDRGVAFAGELPALLRQPVIDEWRGPRLVWFQPPAVRSLPSTGSSPTGHCATPMVLRVIASTFSWAFCASVTQVR